MRMRSTRLRRIAVAALACGVACTPAQDDSAAPAMPNLEVVQRYLDDATAFSGVLLIAKGDDVVFQEARGLADADLGVPMGVQHVFRIGSLTKPITASAVMAAIDRGLLTLDAKICDYLAGCPAAWQPVTVRDLLTHTSGIADHFGDLEAVPVEATAGELQRVLESLPADEALLTPPGSEYAYTNFNYVLLGAVLERVAGKPWEEVLREWMFEPLGLASMRYDDVYAIVPDRVRGYDRDDQGLRNIEYDDHAAFAAGGLLSTAGDLFRWSRGMLSGKVFSSALVQQSLTPFLDNYGFGWQIRSFFERTIYNHTGGIDGFSSHLAHYPDEGLTIVVLSNVESDAAILRACDVAARLFDWPVIARADGPELTGRQRCGVER